MMYAPESMNLCRLQIARARQISLHLLQQNLDEALLLCAVTRKLVSLARELVELAVRLETQDLEFWVAAVVHKIEQVDEDGFQNLFSISNAPRLLLRMPNQGRRIVRTFWH